MEMCRKYLENVLSCTVYKKKKKKKKTGKEMKRINFINLFGLLDDENNFLSWKIEEKNKF